MEGLNMLFRNKSFKIILSAFLVVLSLKCYSSVTKDSVTLYTPYTRVAVSPGESIDFTVDAINNTMQMQNVDIFPEGMPRGWNYTLKAGTWNISQISILPGERKNLSFKADVPLKVNKGSYRFRLLAGNNGVLPITVTVTEQGTFKTEFKADQTNMQGNSSAAFTFNPTLKNLTSDKQLYALMAEAPRGWNVSFKFNYQLVTSVNVEANNSANITVEIKPPQGIEAGTYKIPVSAATASTSATTVLEVVITGSYGMELSTPTGLLSTSITAGDSKRVELSITNTGSSELTDVALEFSAPINWDITFDPKKIDKIQPGKVAKAFATIKADKKAIAGDYVTNIDSKTPEVSSKISLRVSVETPLLYGWVGILVILAALGSIYYLFRKYGRR
jgi:uncharacterized membrane protein